MEKVLWLIKMREIEEELFSIMQDENIKFRWVEKKINAQLGINKQGMGMIEMNTHYQKPEYTTMRSIMIAHELGHWISFTDTFQRDHSLWALCNGDPELTLEEERRAWIAAYNILEGLGFDRWDIFKKASTIALSTYYGMKGGEVHECADKFINDVLNHNLYEEVDAI